MPSILMVASEGVPFCKTGGLADVIGSLPHALRVLGADCRVVLPRYASMSADKFPVRECGVIRVFFDGMVRAVRVHEVDLEISRGVPTYFLDVPQAFRRANLYNYQDDTLRFGLFCRAALELPSVLDWTPDVWHSHDWHAGLLPVYARLLGAPGRHVFTIHNLAYQGVAPRELLPRLGLPEPYFSPRELEFYGQVNPLKGGLTFSDAITTVSPTYAREIQTSEFGVGLDGVLRERTAVLSGILNGLDYEKWNPAHDSYLAQTYDENSAIQGKRANKTALLRLLQLPDDASNSTPLLGIVSRLSAQKGFDILAQAVPRIVELGCKLVILGAGDAEHTRLIADLAKQFPRHISAVTERFAEGLAHLIYAGSDGFLMPSHYEPCGLGQLIALRYGAVPIVRATGGLRDTVTPSRAGGNGFLFDDYSAPALAGAVEEFAACYASQKATGAPNAKSSATAWPQLVQRGMQSDFSWHASARGYFALYNALVSDALLSSAPQAATASGMAL